MDRLSISLAYSIACHFSSADAVLLSIFFHLVAHLLFQQKSSAAISSKAMDQGVHLVYQYFQLQGSNDEERKERQAEYDECLQRNVAHRHVSQVHLLLESPSDLEAVERLISSPKLCLTLLGRRMKYSDAFQYCNENLQGRVAVVMNADIFLGESSNLEDLLQQQQLIFYPNTVLSLTRHEKHICQYTHNASSAVIGWCGCPFFKGRPNYFGSHDSFWLVPPLKPGVVNNCQHVQNRWGAEHKVINELFRHGYRVENPGITIRTYHNHLSDTHPWRKEPGGSQILADPRDHPPLPPTTLSHILETKPS